MQYVNDDMDELFRRAAENYPLDTTGGDWSKVAKALQDPEEIKSPKNGKGRFLWLLLLLPLAFICNPFSRNDRGDLNQSKGVTDQKQELVPGTAADKSRQVQSGTDASENLKYNPVNSNGATVDAITKGTSKISDISLNAASAGKLKRGNLTPVVKTGNKPAEIVTGTVSAERVQKISGGGIASTDQPDGKGYQSFITDHVTSIGSILLINHNPNLIEPSPYQNIVKDFSEPELNGQKPVKRFYAGLMGGIDATTIRFQKWEQAGFSLGVLAGYSLHKNWSVEAGIYREKKFYYTKSRYFNSSKIYLAPNSSISEVSGNCTMFEIPLSLKYDFSSGRKSGWFSTLGVSSYVMKKEDYTYQYYYGTAGPVPHRKMYSNTSTHLFSSLRFSGGYQHELGRIGSIRVEPYFNLPISGMGFGKVKMVSTGLYVGVVKKLW